MKGENKIIKKNAKTKAILAPKFIEVKGFLSIFILHELDARSMSGDELARIIGSRRNSILTPGTIYPALKRLRRQKLIRYKRMGRKKVYFLTDLGKSELKAIYSIFGDFFAGFKKRIRK